MVTTKSRAGKAPGLWLVAIAAMISSTYGQQPALPGPALPGGQIRAGAAKVDITPRLEAAGTAQPGTILPVTSIRDHLHVRAIYFENNVTCGALVGVEQGAMRGSEPAIQKAAHAVGCPRENVIVSAVHTHSGGTRNAAGDTPPDNKPDLKRVSPASKTMMVTLASGPPARSGYIYSNGASDHLTFEVIGSRLKPGCAEDAIVASGVSQIQTLQ